MLGFMQFFYRVCVYLVTYSVLFLITGSGMMDMIPSLELLMLTRQIILHGSLAPLTMYFLRFELPVYICFSMSFALSNFL